MREGLIISDLTSVNPDFSNSFTLAGNSLALNATCWAISSFTRAITHCFISVIFSKVSLFVLSLVLFTGEKINIGGLIEKTLKKEKGLKFLSPFWLIVLTRAMGLGVIDEDRYLYKPSVSPSLTFIVLIIIYLF